MSESAEIDQEYAGDEDKPQVTEGPKSPADKAFIASGSAKLRIAGDTVIELHPYTPDRMIAAQCMGMHYGFLSDAEVAQYRRSGIYPGMSRDVINHIWLRSLEKEVDIDEAQLNPRTARKLAAEFAAKNNMADQRTKVFSDASGIFLDAMEALRISRTEPKPGRKKKETTPLKT